MVGNADLALLEDIDVWVFDLDNTLYPFDSNLFAQVDRRMTGFISDLLKVDATAAKKIQKDFYRDYGTTLKGLMQCHHVKPQPFLDYVHDIDYSCLKADAQLASALHALPGRKFIFTNGSRRHAEHVCHQLGILELFNDIFDIEAADYAPKPEYQAYTRFLQHFSIDAVHAVMFEDLEQNLTTAKKFGMRTVLLVPDDDTSPAGEIWQRGDEDPPDIDFITKDLPHFLTYLSR